jgi:hypothetical protein
MFTSPAHSFGTAKKLAKNHLLPLFTPGPGNYQTVIPRSQSVL